jgi:hypothetical protein
LFVAVSPLRQSGGSVGIAFDVPAETVKSVVAQLKDKGMVSRGWIGVTADIAESLGMKGTEGAPFGRCHHCRQRQCGQGRAQSRQADPPPIIFAATIHLVCTQRTACPGLRTF